MKLTLSLILASFVLLSSCVSTEMYTPDGYLSQYGAKQTDIEMNAVTAECTSKYTRTESARYDCARQLVPLYMRYAPEFSDLYATVIEDWKNVTLGYEAGNISKETTIETLDKLTKEYAFNNQILIEQYHRVISTRNARAKEFARQQMGMALNQIGTELMRQSSNDMSITCTETAPGTVTCSEW